LLELATPAPTPAPKLQCSDLKNLTFRGQNWTDVVQTVCLSWPEGIFGNFPVEQVQDLEEIINKVFDRGGLWDQFDELFSKGADAYCLRQEVTRIELVTAASESTCPATLDEDILEEMPDKTDTNPELLEGSWACASGDVEDRCNCRRRDDLDAVEIQTVEIASRPSGCKMVHAGKCYGDCPRGYRPTFLKGWFRPVCTSVCADTNHPVTCGVGCANSRSSCISVILRQTREVVVSASKVAAFFTAGTAGLVLATAVEQVVKVAEFGFNVLSEVLKTVDAAFKIFSREKAELATAITIFQILVAAGSEISKNVAQFVTAVSSSTKLVLQLIDAKFGWKNINLGWIANAIMKNGAAALDGAFSIIKAFDYQKCKLADEVVAFTIEDVGDQRVIGPWTQDGNTNSKPFYRLIADKANVVLEWSRRSKYWAIWVKDRTFGRGWWFGWLGFGWRELYYTRSGTAGFPTTGWRKWEGALPLPELVSATNGGVSSG